MKSVLLSVQPKWCELIASGKKTVEVRKNRPQLETPFKCYIYCTKTKCMTMQHGFFGYLDELYRANNGEIKYGFASPDDWPVIHMNGKVIGEFMCDKISDMFSLSHFWIDQWEKPTCLTMQQIWEYSKGLEHLYAWHISDLKIYDKPKELRYFHAPFYNYCPSELCESNTPCDKSCLFRYSCLKITRAPQSWRYVEELEEY